MALPSILKGPKGQLFALKLVISLLLLFGFYKFVGRRESFEALLDADWRYVLAGCLCIVLVQVAKSARFLLFSRILGLPVKASHSLLAHFIVPIIGMVTPGKLGEGAKIFLLQSSKRRLGFLFLVERVLDLLALVFVAGFGFAFSRFFFITYLVMVAMILGGIVAFLKLDWILNKATTLLFKKQYFPEHFFWEQSRKLLGPQLLGPLLLTVLVWAITFSSSYCFTRAVGVELSFPRIALVFSWAVLIGLFSSLPGGVGPREMGMALLFDGLYHVPQPQGAAIAAINLVTHYVVLGLLGCGGYLVYKLRKERLYSEAATERLPEEGSPEVS